jgi:predicted RNA-binding Zn-ribbon protein involved in translation (DUF1610 family)
MKITETMSREERRAAVALTAARRDLLILMHQKNNSPAETVAELIGRIGYQAARETIAEAVRGRGAWDGRISEAARIWAAEIDTAADRGMLMDHYLISDAIHPAHIDQIALAAAEYDREKPETTFVYDARRIRWFLLNAIRRDAQGAALDAVALGFEAETRKDITSSQRHQLSAIYDAWECGWCALEEAEAAEAAAAEEAPAEEIAAEEPDEALPMKIYVRADGEGTTFYASEARIWHASGLDLIIHSRYGNTGVYVHGAAQKPARTAEDENRSHCKHIAQELDAYVNDEVKRCPECGEIHRRDWGQVGDLFKCPNCGEVTSLDDWEWLSIWDFLSDVFDVEYRCGSDREYRSVRVMVACGGPNIYLNSATKDVELYWWNERSRYPMSYEAAEALDQWAEDCWNM